MQLARLRAAVAEGVRGHNEGRFIEINSKAELRKFFDDIKREGRARLKRRRAIETSTKKIP